jgi:hypothetical protein
MNIATLRSTVSFHSLLFGGVAAQVHEWRFSDAAVKWLCVYPSCFFPFVVCLALVVPSVSERRYGSTGLEEACTYSDKAVLLFSMAVPEFGAHFVAELLSKTRLTDKTTFVLMMAGSAFVSTIFVTVFLSVLIFTIVAANQPMERFLHIGIFGFVMPGIRQLQMRFTVKVGKMAVGLPGGPFEGKPEEGRRFTVLLTAATNVILSSSSVYVIFCSRFVLVGRWAGAGASVNPLLAHPPVSAVDYTLFLEQFIPHVIFGKVSWCARVVVSICYLLPYLLMRGFFFRYLYIPAVRERLQSCLARTGVVAPETSPAALALARELKGVGRRVTVMP